VLTLLALLHLNAQVTSNLQAESVDLYTGPSAAEIDALNAPILREAEARGALSPYVDPERIELPIETLRRLALDEAQHYLGLSGEPATQEEFYLTQGQWLTIAKLDIARDYLPDRTVPVLIMHYSSTVGDSSVSRANSYRIVVDATTGEVISTTHGPSKSRPIDVNIKDRGYMMLDTSLTPQAPLPVPPATG
jgi:hypothetical protein